MSSDGRHNCNKSVVGNLGLGRGWVSSVLESRRNACGGISNCSNLTSEDCVQYRGGIA